MLADGSETTLLRPGTSTSGVEWRDDLELLWSYLTGSADERPTDVLFCFGSFYFGVARHAAALYEAGVAPVVLVSGGVVGRIEPYATEADAYVDVLRGSGVPHHRIAVDRHAANTGENVRFGMAVLAERGTEVRSATLVAWPTSLRRCAATFARQFPGVDVRTQPAFRGLGPYSSTPARAVETCLAELARLRAYPRRGYITEQAIPESVDCAAERLSFLLRHHRSDLELVALPSA